MNLRRISGDCIEGNILPPTVAITRQVCVSPHGRWPEPLATRAAVPWVSATPAHPRLERSLPSSTRRHQSMTAHAHPTHAPLLSGIAHASDATAGDAGLARQLDVLLLDQVRSWGWDDMLFVECGDGWAAEEAWRRRRARGHVVALDMSPGAIERARTLRGVAGRVEFATWDGHELGQAS